MGLHDTVSWYQRKIGTYDKQQWEKTVEQRILTGFKHVLKKTAKLKTDLIDVDLVRGSSFAKAKPKHGLAKVTKLAVIRWLFLPFYWSWWIQQTCVATFSLLLFLYVLQIFNIFLYFYFSSFDGKLLERVSAYEVIVPAAMMLVLSLVHSEIVATSSCRPAEGCSVKRARRGIRRTERTEKSRQHVDAVPDSIGRFPTSDDVTESGGCERQAEGAAGLRRRTVAWRAPLREPAPPQPLPPRAADDDGFESLTSHASSDDVPGLRHVEPAAEAEEPDTAARSPAWLLSNSRVGRSSCCLRCRSQDSTHFTDTDSELDDAQGSPQRLLQRRRSSKSLQVVTHEHYDSSCESEAPSPPRERGVRDKGTEEASGSEWLRSREKEGASGSEWLGVTTNSEECSVSSDVDDSSAGDSTSRQMDDHPFAWEFQMSPSSTISPSCASSDRVSCTLWEERDVKRADLSVLDISSAIIARVESMPENIDYFYGGICLSVVIALLPSLCRLIEVGVEGDGGDAVSVLPPLDAGLDGVPVLGRLAQLVDVMLGDTALERLVSISAAVERFCLACLFFFLAAVAERTLKQRFLYAKLFSHLTSFRRARRSQLPHFRLNKVRNIKTWLSVRSYLKKRGPQRSVDVIVSASFIITLLLLSFLTVELLKDSARLHSEYNLEALVWCLALGLFLLRFMTLGNKTNRKYRNVSVLLTEQINLYLQIEQKPNKKEELMVANSVLKLAADLLKELESPFKISGLSTNPYLYTITKVVILSALSGVLSEMLGFKLKLHNIKISSLK